MMTRLWSFLRREPLVHFFALAGLLFVANAVFSGDDREVITVDAATQEYVIKQQQDLLLRDMTDGEKADVVETYIDEEILVREARKRGFETSSRIRALLIQNMRFFMTNDVPDPTEEELRAYFTDNIDRFATAPTASYEFVYFRDPDSVPPSTLATLRAGADPRRIGDRSPLAPELERAGERQIVATFGRAQAPHILAIDDDRWHGPFTSLNGTHFLRVAERHPSRRPAFESAKGWLAQEWRLAKSREDVARELAEMRKNYRIEIEPMAGAPR